MAEILEARKTNSGSTDLHKLDHAFAERAAAVQADVVHGAIGAVHVGDAYGVITCLLGTGKFFGFVGGREGGLGGELDEGHDFRIET